MGLTPPDPNPRRGSGLALNRPLPFATIMPRQFVTAAWAQTLSNADENSLVR
jgi:hypothetical protein